MRGGRGKKCSVGGTVKPSDSYASYKRGGPSSPYRSHMVEGAQSAKRYDRPGRRFGGRVGADSAPLSEASMVTPPQYKSGGWIKGAIKNPGALHRDLGVPQGEKIPAAKIEAATHSSNPKVAARARLAKTLKKMH